MDKQPYETHLFVPVKPLFPNLFAPNERGKISVTLQFVIPGLKLPEKEKSNLYILIKKLFNEIWNAKIQCNSQASLIEIAFYINEGDDHHRAIENKSRMIIERFLGILSYSAGIKLSAKNIVPTIFSEKGNQMILHAQMKTEMPQIRFVIPKELYDKDRIISDEVFSALFWLRRGLAEGDPIDTYNAFMVCLQILAKDWWDKKIASGCTPFEQPPTMCPRCGNDLPKRGQYPPITSLFREYIIREFGASKAEVKDVWSIRNAIAAHGNEPQIDADDFLKITELKFKAAAWAYQGINLALGLDSSGAPKPSSNFFVTDALMHLD